jgi:hypothetical protein
VGCAPSDGDEGPTGYIEIKETKNQPTEIKNIKPYGINSPLARTVSWSTAMPNATHGVCFDFFFVFFFISILWFGSKQWGPHPLKKDSSISGAQDFCCKVLNIELFYNFYLSMLVTVVLRGLFLI